MRYSNRRIINNGTDEYKHLIEKRGVKTISHYSSTPLKHPTVEQMKNLEFVEVVWKSNSRLWKLAADYYGDSKLWWVLAWFNRTPLESDIQVGDVIQVPLPLDQVLNYMGL